MRSLFFYSYAYCITNDFHYICPMADKMTPQQRHKGMSHIRSKNTQPEWIVRRHLWHEGLRYRLHVKSLPGCPDIVIRRLKTAIFVNGCFWHGHKCQHHFPSKNRKFWFDKISRNRSRDLQSQQSLEAMGWIVIVIWECQLSRTAAPLTLQRLTRTLQLISNTKSSAYYSTPVEASPLAAEPDYSYPEDTTELPADNIAELTPKSYSSPEPTALAAESDTEYSAK